jgi:uncharacterized membrane protein YqaE (UPF0057 family)
MNDSRPKRVFPSGNQAWLTLLSGIVVTFWSGLLFAIYRGAMYPGGPNLVDKLRGCAVAFVIGIFITIIGFMLVLIHAARS